MHELSIALSLVELASETAERVQASRVIALHLRVGPLAGIVQDALEFSFVLAAADTPAAGARLVFEPVPLVAFCPSCDAERTITSPQHLRCPECGGSTPEVRSGRELELAALEIPDGEDR